MADKKHEGFLEGLLKDAANAAIIEASRDSRGKIDPYKAAGIAFGSGNMNSFEDTMTFGAMLGAKGAFSDDPDDKGF